MKSTATIFLLLILLVSGCRSPKAVYLFSKSHQQVATTSAGSDSVVLTSEINGSHLVSRTRTKIISKQIAESEITAALLAKTAAGGTKSYLAENNSLQQMANQEQVEQGQMQVQYIKSLLLKKLKKASGKKSLNQKERFLLDPSPQSIDALLVFALMLALTALAILLGITFSWWPLYFIAAGFFILGLELQELIMNYDRKRIFASDYIKLIVGVALLTTAAIFAVKLVLLLSTFYIILLLCTLVLAFFIWQIIRYYTSDEDVIAK